MKKKHVLKYYKGSPRAVATALNISTQAVGQWKEKIPEAMAARLDKLTGGKLEYRLADYQ